MIVIGGYRCCKKCIAKSGLEGLDALSRPGIWNRRNNIRHLRVNKRNLSTLCGKDTRNPNWEVPWDVDASQRAYLQRESKREREHRLELEQYWRSAQARLYSGLVRRKPEGL